MRMTEIERLEAQLKCRKMVEGTGLDWWTVVKLEGMIFNDPPAFDYAPGGYYEFALGVIENKAVWEGSVLYFIKEQIPTKITEYSNIRSNPNFWSWNPSKPKTITLEFKIETAIRLLEWMELISITKEPSLETEIVEILKKALNK